MLLVTSCNSTVHWRNDDWTSNSCVL